MLLITAGLGPLADTMALALHTMGVLGRLFAKAVENAPFGPAAALRAQGVPKSRIFWYTTLPQVLPQLMIDTLSRWKKNIRAAEVLGLMGAGGLCELLMFHMDRTTTVLAAILLMVALVDTLSYAAHLGLTQ